MSSSELSGTRRDEEPLADMAERVLVLFHCCKRIRDTKARFLAEEQLSRFKSWARNVGVFAAQHASLDYRLRTAPSSRALVEINLDTVCIHLLGTLKGSSKVSDEEFDNLLNAPRSKVLADAINMLLKSRSNRSLREKQLKLVGKMIDTLFQSFYGMQRAINGKTLVKIPRLMDFDKDYAIIRERGGDSADAGVPVDDIRFDIGAKFEDFLRKALTHKWFRLRSSKEEDLDDERKNYQQVLFERCVTTISARRRQLAYFQAHCGHEEASGPRLKVAGFKPRLSHMVLRSSLSTFADDRFGFRFGGPLDAPPPPKRTGNEEEKVCPYCRLVLPAETFSTQKRAELWERHLLDDLQPYICLFANCEQAGRTYSSFAEWRHHNTRVHYRSWECSLHTDGKPDRVGDRVFIYDTLEKFKDHIRLSHPGLSPSFAEDWSHQKHTAPLPQRCFVCWQEIPEFETLLKHIASHLESMSLLALPWRDDITVEEDITSDKATCSVATDDAVGKHLYGTYFCGWKETGEVMMEPVEQLDKHEFSSLPLTVNETPQDRLQILEAWAQESCLNAPGWSRARKNWSLALLVVETITELRKNAVWSQARCLKPRIRDRIPWHRDYTVGWICALPSDFEASKAMLDYEYRLPFPDSDYDPNNNPNSSYGCDSYVYGRIGHHDVAIAWIGGGIPSTSKDIRLRDVTGGDLSIDSGGMVREGVFVQRESLNICRLPQDLQTAIETLKADHQIGHKLSKHLQALLDRCEEMKAQYSRPAPETNILFSINDDHLGTEGDGSQYPKNLVELGRARGFESIVHYGLVASGNKIIKHGAKRYRLSSEFGIEFSQTEPTDLTHGFHCLFIRGISDYADSHNNDIWEPYAAAMAAAYAKELLHVLPPTTSVALFPDVWYRLTQYLSYTRGIDIEENSTSADGGMRITLELTDADRLGQYWTFQPRDTEGSWTISTMALPDSVLGVHPGDETRLSLEPAAFTMGQQWQITSRGGGAVNIWNRSLGSEGYLCTRGDPVELTLSEKNENDASQLWRLHPVGIVGQQCSQSDDMMMD
ncbi:hypothetical protein H0G86_002684 [Trichoderma simmonsii]|uniref:Uncharacterized protein n=1 Tax=Trichoderma simmonsii TaxID=1491479 RepID=A0A8G0L403_9HYPO|nr:hypothetical protein H0G86_002684 [Trichoderma simmonsii]